MENKDDKYNIDNCTSLLQMDRIITEQKKEDEMKMMQKKRNRTNSKTEITYDANTKKLINCFCPNAEELRIFLENCEVREIKDINEIKNLKISSNDIFDPEQFINNNYKSDNYKAILSIEDISLMNNNEVSEEKEYLPHKIKKVEIPEDKFIVQNNMIKNILNNEILTESQKAELNKLILETKKMNIKHGEFNLKKFYYLFDLNGK